MTTPRLVAIFKMDVAIGIIAAFLTGTPINTNAARLPQSVAAHLLLAVARHLLVAVARHLLVAGLPLLAVVLLPLDGAHPLHLPDGIEREHPTKRVVEVVQGVECTDSKRPDSDISKR